MGYVTVLGIAGEGGGTTAIQSQTPWQLFAAIIFQSCAMLQPLVTYCKLVKWVSRLKWSVSSNDKGCEICFYNLFPLTSLVLQFLLM